MFRKKKPLDPATCKACGADIKVITARRNGGVCWPCARQKLDVEWREREGKAGETLASAPLPDLACAHAPILFRLLGLGLPFSRVDTHLRGHPDWEEWKASRQRGDRIWPFCFNQNSLAMRKGYVIVRKRKPMKVIVTELS